MSAERRKIFALARAIRARGIPCRVASDVDVIVGLWSATVYFEADWSADEQSRVIACNELIHLREAVS